MTMLFCLQFPLEDYTKDLAENAALDRHQVVAKLKRSSTGFSR